MTDTNDWIARPATAEDFDQRPRPEWMLGPWKDRPPIELKIWEQRPTSPKP